MRLLKKVGSPSGVRRQTWLGTMFNELREFQLPVAQCLHALAQSEHRLLVLPGNGGHDKRRKRRDDQKKLQHDLPLPLRFGIADKLAVTGHCKCHRDQGEECQGDGSASELKAHRNPKKWRQDDVGGGQMTAQGKRRQPQERSVQGCRLQSTARQRVGTWCASAGSRPVPLALRARFPWRLQSRIAAIPP